MTNQKELELNQADKPKENPARPKAEPHKRVVNGFKRLDYQQALKAITEIDEYWNEL